MEYWGPTITIRSPLLLRLTGHYCGSGSYVSAPASYYLACFWWNVRRTWKR